MAKKKEKVTNPIVTQDTDVTVVEADPGITLVNPYVEVQVHIEGLEPYVKSGLRASTLKTVRAWVRARGASVTYPGTIKEVTHDAGKPFLPKNEEEEVTPDLIVFRFTTKCLAENNAEINIPSPKAAKQPTVEVVTVEMGETANVTEAVSPAEEVSGSAEEVAPKDW